MDEKKQEKKKSSQCCKGLSDKVDVIYDILAAHKLGLESLEKKVDSISFIVNKLKGRSGL